MKINGNAIRPGMVIDHRNRLWRVVKIAHTQPGKGGAYLQVELKDICDGTKLNERFRASEPVERVRLEQKDHQYLFRDGDTYTFMDVATYDQITLSEDFIGKDLVIFLQESMTVLIESREGIPTGIQLPEKITLKIAAADTVIKGQTASSSYKSAVLENGVKILVPPHIGTDTRVVVNPYTREYVERAKN